MSNSSLVNYVKISPHKTVGNYKKDKITIHHMAGNLSVETCGNVFQNRQASTQYGIGSDGRIGMYVEEKDRAWSTANPSNDKRAVNIELANDKTGGNWHVSDKAIAKCIELCVDICKRNGIAKLIYTGDASGNLTTHDMFMATTCPGPYLKSKMNYIAEEVNKRLEKPTLAYSVGDYVEINGVYSSSTSKTKLNPLDKVGKITKILKGTKNPYLLNNGAIGWTNDSCIICKIDKFIKVGDTVSVSQDALIGGLASNRGKQASNYLKSCRWKVKQLATHKGEKEALLSCNTWIAIKYLSLV